MKPIAMLLIGIVGGVILAHIIAEITVATVRKKLNKRNVIQGQDGFSVELLPCPFCGANTQDIIREEVNEMTVTAMTCQTCGARTGYYIRPIEAVIAWNSTAEREFKN
jgi:Lar family restriction alleviation protein